MIVVGELINASRKAIKQAIESEDKAELQRIAKAQRENGADYIDVNAGVFEGREPELLAWLVELVQEATDGAPCSLDSPDPKAIRAALEVHQGPALINSISLEKERYEALLPILSGSLHKVVALCMSDAGMPETTEQRVAIADDLVKGLTGEGVPLDNIYVDPLVQPISTSDRFGVAFLEAVREIRRRHEGVHTMCGLSNISYGLPNRKLLNRTFMVMAIANGLDGAIINPLDEKMMTNIISAEALAGNDAWCEQYLNAYRAERLKV
jgi:5-methyltetrahydrofolate--homocysteine methyltransferase